MTNYILSLLIFVPLVAAGVLLWVPSRNAAAFKWGALVATGIQLVLAVIVFFAFQYGDGSPSGVHVAEEFQFVEKADWITLGLGDMGQLSVDYYLGVDGLSIAMVLLAAMILVIGVIASWKVTEKVKGYFLLYLLLSSAILGCFLALDFFLFYLFFEFMLLPMYFLIGIWGGPRRAYASIKFFLYTLVGSIFIFLAMIGLYFSTIDPVETAVQAGLAEDVTQVTEEIIARVQHKLQNNYFPAKDRVHTFNMVHMMDPANMVPGSVFHAETARMLFGTPARLMGFLALFIGFIIKLPAVPLHTWLPDAHVEASTPISVILAGILLKIGGYGLLRTAWSIFPEGAVHYAFIIAVIGVISILYGAMNALAMRDLKKMIAYSSVSHMGYVLLGMASLTVEGLNGVVYQMFSHGIIAATLFLIAGVVYSRTGDRMISHYSGLASKMPYYAAVTTVAFFASLGLPGFSGFIAEVLVFLGAFSSESVNGLVPRWLVIIACLGLILGAAYFLWTLQRMFFGTYRTKGEWDSKLTDLTPREYIMFVPLGLAALFFGVFPSFLLDRISPSIARFAGMVWEQGVWGLEVLAGF